ncbi:MAG: maleylacetate reductase [Acidobacteria bacterium]|nr:maleylacetate reductase [Acidobacteriota bacterium]
MPTVFTHSTPAQRVRFGAGRATEQVVAEVALLGARRVLLVVSRSAATAGAAIAAAVPVAATLDRAVQHVPAELVATARGVALDAAADAIVVVGGGSAVGLAKAVAIDTGIPVVAVPTTFAGSEATDVWGITEHGVKTTGADPRALPVAVVYDSALLAGLPADLAVASGLNALAHCVDSLWAPKADPINAAAAAEGMRLLATGLRGLHRAARDQVALEQVMAGAYLGAIAFASAGSGLHHRICHVLGGAYGLPHAPMHAVVLPFVVGFNAPAAPEAAARITAALRGSDAAGAIRELEADLGAPTSLAELGFDPDRAREAAGLILPAVPQGNPRPVHVQDLEGIVAAAAGHAATRPAEQERPTS